jgi:outer membrane receptor protein involved in Fe transport
VSSSTSGSIDINTLPQDILKRVEIVTGGASAAYGSDAVAGVVNFILDQDFNGVRASIQSGISQYGDGATRGVAVTAGTRWGGGNGHLLISGEYFDQARIGFDNGRAWSEAGYGIITIPPGPNRLVAAPFVFSNSTAGGLITTGPLANTQFLQGGVRVPFAAGLYRNTVNMIGGDGILIPTDLTAGVARWSTFARADYDLGDVTVFAEAGYSQSITRADIQKTSSFGSAAFMIFRDNAFLPAATRAALPAGPTGDSFRLGRINLDFPDAKLYSRSRTLRLVTGLDWSFGGSWHLNAYYSFGQNKYRVNTLDTQIFRQLYAAADAVVNPANGQIVCRSTLSGFDPGCVPINLFGQGSPSQAAIDYVTGDTQSDLTLRENVASVTVGGSPFSLNGNAINVAAGVEYRSEVANQTTDPTSLLVNDATGLRGFPAGLVGSVGGSPLGNYFELHNAHYNVKEAFAEAEVPLLRNVPLAHELVVNGAVRLIDYSTVGRVTTWKAGLSYSPVPDLRFRVTRSRDIRAGNIAELFSPAFISRPSVLINGATTAVNQVRVGDPNLRPEKADTFTGGVVFSPRWLPGLNLSVDVFDIRINGAVQQLTAQQTFDQCAAGSTLTCAQISLANGLYTVRTPFLNLASLKTRGVDIDLSYRTRLGDGQLQFRGIFSYLDRLSTELPGVPAVERAGDVGVTGTPRYSGNLAVTYGLPNVDIMVQERYIGSGKLDNTIPAGVIDRNYVPSVFYTDATVRFRVGDQGRFEFFMTVNNLFNTDPPLAPNIPSGLYRATNFSLYDVLGRFYTAGARVRF